MTIEELQYQKTQLEIAKLNAEITNLRRPFWLAQGHYLLGLSGVAALLVGLYQIKKTNHEFRLAELQKTKLEAETKLLENTRDDYNDEIEKLNTDRTAIQKENAALGAQTQEMAKYVTTQKPTAAEFNAQMAAVRAKTFPLRPTMPSLKLPPGLKGQLTLEMSQDGKLAVTVKLSGIALAKTVKTPAMDVTIRDIQSGATIHSFRIPSATITGKEHLTMSGWSPRKDYQYKADQQIPVDALTAEIANKVFSSAQIDIQQ